MASRKKPSENAEHDGALAALNFELANCAEPSALADALARIKKQKKLPALVKHQSFSILAETLVRKMSEWDPAAGPQGYQFWGD